MDYHHVCTDTCHPDNGATTPTLFDCPRIREIKRGRRRDYFANKRANRS